MRAVPVHLDPGVGVALAPGVPAHVVATLHHDDVQPALGRLLGDREAEESRPDDDQVRPHATSSRGAVAPATGGGVGIVAATGASVVNRLR